MTENEFILQDRLNVIRDTINKYGEENFYLSFSGGKDSTVVHYLLDMALPDNRIPRVYSNTGIEYNKIVEFVREREREDDRFVVIHPAKNIKKTLEEVGYPFKSKEHSCKLGLYQRGSRSMSVMRYINQGTQSTKFCCPDALLYQFKEGVPFKVSEFCCHELKKKPFKKYQKESGRHITITGMMRDEGGERAHINCIVTRNSKVVKFHPLAKVNSEWEEWFIKEYHVKLCDLYYPPFNFKRTGCKGCPFSLDLQEQLAIMDRYGMENERKQCEFIWQPVYAEYRRIGYRLKNEEQTKLF